MTTNLGFLEEVTDLRSVWPHEAHDFTPWLAGNIDRLGKSLGIDIIVEETESPVGGFNADIYATDADTGKRIVIENQLEETNHDHLGKLITYASGKGASLIIWVVKKAREEHHSAIEWLNAHTDDEVGFVLCEIKLYRIGNSEIAPYFEIIDKPNNWAKEMKRTQKSVERTQLPKIADMLEWGVVKPGDIITSDFNDEEVVLMENGHVTSNGEEMSLQQWLRAQSGWPSIQTYNYAIHKEKGKTLSEIRKDYMAQNTES